MVNSSHLAITCPDPGIPLHGNRHCSNRYFVYNSSCSFTCQHGYRLLGNKDIRCLTTSNYYEISEWSHTAPACQSKFSFSWYNAKHL